MQAVFIVQGADLLLSISFQETVNSGTSLPVNVICSNYGPSTALSPEVTLHIPEVMTYDVESASVAVLVLNATTVVFTLPQMEPFDKVVISFSLAVGSAIPTQEREITASISDATLPDNILKNNEDSRPIMFLATAEVDIFLKLLSTKSSHLKRGETGVMVLTVKNKGPALVQHAVIELLFPDTSVSLGTDLSVVATEIQPGSDASLQAVVTIPTDFNDNYIIFTGRMGATAVSPRVTDKQTVIIITESDITASIRVVDDMIMGELAQFVISGGNKGPSTALQLTIVMTIPSDLVFEKSSGEAACIHKDGVLTCVVAALEPKKSFGQIVTVAVLDAEELSVRLEIDLFWNHHYCDLLITYYTLNL